MALKIFPRYEDPSHPLLGINLYILQRFGLWQLKQSDKYFYNIIHVSAFLFLITQYIELWIIRTDFEMALRNLSVTMLSSVCIFKSATLFFWQRNWRELVEFVSNLEIYQLSKNDSRITQIIVEYTKYSRMITYFYLGLTSATVLYFNLLPLFEFLAYPDYRERIKNGTESYPQILSSWVPFDKTRGFGYWITIVEHLLMCSYGGGALASYDTNAVAIMTFFTGQLDILTVNCARLFDESTVIDNYDEAIKLCHDHHVNLVKFANIFNSLLSPVMSLYVSICSVMICASAVQLTMEGASNLHRFWIAEYLMALIVQLFLYCWHGNKVMYKSSTVAYSVFSSSWWSQNVRARRSVILLIGQLQKPMVFTAGPFIKLNVAAFLTILKGSYSCYTLLSKTEE